MKEYKGRLREFGGWRGWRGWRGVEERKGGGTWPGMTMRSRGRREEELEAGKLSVFSITIPTLPTSGGSSRLVIH
jgi:hypothetical protein